MAPGIGIKTELKFVNHIRNLLENKTVTGELFQRFNKENKKIKKGEKIISIKEAGTKRGTNTKEKKPDLFIITDKGNKIGISYKMSNSFTVQSWTKPSVWEEKVGKENFRNFTKKLILDLKNHNIKRTDRPYVGIMALLTDESEKEKQKNKVREYPFEKYFPGNCIIPFYFDEDTHFVFQGDDFEEITTPEQFVKSKCLFNRKEIKENKKLNFMLRNLHTDQKCYKSNVPHLLLDINDDINNVHYDSMSEVMKNAKFIPYYESKNRETSCQIVDRFQKEKNITFTPLK